MSMRRHERIKRRMVRDAVEDNLRLVRGVPPPRPGQSVRVILTIARALFLVALPAVLFASSYMLSSVADEWLEDPGAQAGAGASLRSAALSNFGAREIPPVLEVQAGFAAPEPLDLSVLPLTLKKVVIDPGHGGGNKGTVAPGGLVEKEITLDISLRLARLLESGGYEVVLTRTKDEPLSLQERAEMANAAMGDIFLSIHVNWIENQEVRGVETFYLGPTEDPYVTRLAAQENQDSGYSLADFRRILERVYADVRQGESRQLAGSVQHSLYGSLRKINREVRNRGIKTAPFGVLTRTDMPAILAEVSCLSNDLEARLLMTSSYRQFLAEALFSGIQSYARGLVAANQLGS